MRLWPVLAVPVVVATCAAELAPSEAFYETLRLRTLDAERVHAAFTFDLEADAASLHHFGVLPRALLQPVASLGVDEMRLGMSAGRWDYAAWGRPGADTRGDDGVASGAEISAQFGPADAAVHNATLAQRWRVLTSALASVFCASLDGIDADTTVALDARMVPRAMAAAPPTAQLHAYLPSERVCTENITPLLKLLPCKGGAGLASLVRTHAVLSAEFHGVSVHVQRRGPSGWHVVLRLHAVMRTPNATFTTLFGRALTHACPVAAHSAVEVETPGAPPAPAPTHVPDDDDDDERADPYVRPTAVYTYDTRSLAAWDGVLDVQVPSAAGTLARRPPLLATRQVQGAGQERNEVRLTLRNDLAAEAVHVVYFDHLPWSVLPLMHTLAAHATVDAYGARRRAMRLTPDESDERVRYRDDVDAPFVTHTEYTPAQLRGATGAVALTLRVPASSTLTVTYTLVKQMLHYSEHVPDPHRGIDLSPALFVPLDAGVWRPAARVQPTRLYAPPSLLDIAVPDFSMPYNIILFYSTFVALFFGSLLNNMMRRYSDVYR